MSSDASGKLGAALSAAAASLAAPGCDRRPHAVKVGRHEVESPYFWLRDDARKDKAVLAELERENKYCEAAMAPTQPLQEALNAEFLSHLKEDDAEAPFAWGDGGWFYQRRTEKGKDYPVWVRGRALAANGLAIEDAQVVLDVNAAATGHDFFDVGSVSMSPDHLFLAYSVDTKGHETYDVVVSRVDPGTGALERVETLADVSGSLEWGADSSELYYSRLDHAHRPWQLVRHRAGTPQAEDEVVVEEPDEEFWMGFSRCESGAFLFCRVASKTTSEVRYVPLDAPGRAPLLLEARRDGVLYRASHTAGHFYIVTNDGQVNMKLVRAPTESPGRESWRVVEAAGGVADPTATVTRVACFERHVAVFGRAGGLTTLSVLDAGSDGPARPVPFDEELYTVEQDRNRSFGQRSVRVSYTSLVTPDTTCDVDLATGEVRTVKVKEVPGYDRSLYRQERVEVPSKDGTAMVPVSLVYRASARREAENRVLLYGYGSYGVCIDPEFSFLRLPLLDRGVVFAIAHIRGGGENGRQWYYDGKLLSKRNTFDDFLACAEHLVDSGFTDPSRLAISGGSAGGLLMGAVLNARPGLFRACYTRVPFVDVVCTMSDVSIPLTVAEFTEWGDPRDDKYFEYIKSYSPIDNVRPQKYPAMLVTAGLHDSRCVAPRPPSTVLSHARTRATCNLLTLATPPFQTVSPSGSPSSTSRRSGTPAPTTMTPRTRCSSSRAQAATAGTRAVTATSARRPSSTPSSSRILASVTARSKLGAQSNR